MKRALALLLVLFAGSAFADELMRYTTPAERARGCVWADRFESQALVESNAGTVTGAPTFSPVTGVTLDGAADYLTYNLTGQEFNSDPLSIVVEFTPDFAYDDNVDVIIMSTTGDNTLVRKRNNAAANVLRINIGATIIAEIPTATYGPLWLQGQRNTIVISGTSGATNCWFNSTQILTADPSAWTPAADVILRIGAGSAGGNWFDGTIHSLQVYHCLLTAAEAQDFHDHSTYTWENQATAHYQMRLVDHDATNTRSLDSSGNGNHVTLVNAPTKLAQRHGYGLNGTTQYFSGGPASPTGDFSVIAYFKTDSVFAQTDIVCCNSGPAPAVGWYLNAYDDRLYFELSDDGSGAGGHYSFVALAGALAVGKEVVAVATYDFVTDGTSIATVYADDLTPAVDATFNGPVFAGAPAMSIGAFADGTLTIGDSVYYVAVLDGIVLTPLQVEDVKHTLRQRGNQP